MSDQDPTLCVILFDGNPANGAEALFNGVKQDMPRVVADWNDIKLAAIKKAICDQVASCFNVTIGQVLGQVWSDAEQVREALDPARTPPGTEKKIPLVSHKIEWTTRPRLIVKVSGVKTVDLTYELVLDLTIDGAVLKISDGRLREVWLGAYQGAATLLIKGTKIAEYSTQQWRLPGKLSIDRDVPLRRRTPKWPEAKRV